MHCHYCGSAATLQDHIVPRSLGGPDSPWNLTPSCDLCNAVKHAKWPTCSCPSCTAAVEEFMRHPDYVAVATAKMTQRLERLRKQRVRALEEADRAHLNAAHVVNILATLEAAA